MVDYLVPLLLFAACSVALWKKENAYDTMLMGATEGLRLLASMVPTLILLLTAVTMLRQSGAVEYLRDCHMPTLTK
jgi:spore maturation protein B